MDELSEIIYVEENIHIAATFKERKPTGIYVKCPECEHDLEIKEVSIPYSFSKEGIRIQKALNAANRLISINKGIVYFLGISLSIFFIQIDLKLEAYSNSYLFWIINVTFRILGMACFIFIESKLILKIVKKLYPDAYY